MRLDTAEIASIARELDDGTEMTVDLADSAITTPAGRRVPFSIAAERRDALLAGLDEIGMTLRLDPAIRAHQERERAARPWLRALPARILALPGDGVGPEVMEQTQRVVAWFAERRGLPIELREEHWGVAAWGAHGSLMRDETWRAITEADAILFGATSYGTRDYADIPEKVDWLLEIRRRLDLFTNLRPVRPLTSLLGHSSLRREVVEGADVLIVRELTGGIYFATPRGVTREPDGRREAVNTVRYTDDQIARIARAAFELARGRRGRVHSVDKAIVLEVGNLWREVVTEVHAAEFADVELTHMLVDNCAMQLVRGPHAVRRHRHGEPLRRHPLRLRGDGRRVARHAAVGVAGRGPPRRRAPRALRADPRQRARHLRAGDRQSPRLDPQLRALPAPLAERAGRGAAARARRRGCGRARCVHARHRPAGRDRRADGGDGRRGDRRARAASRGMIATAPTPRTARVTIETGHDAAATLDRLLERTELLARVAAAADVAGVDRAAFEIAIKPTIMVAPGAAAGAADRTDPALVERLVAALAAYGFGDVAVVESAVKGLPPVAEVARERRLLRRGLPHRRSLPGARAVRVRERARRPCRGPDVARGRLPDLVRQGQDPVAVPCSAARSPTSTAACPRRTSSPTTTGPATSSTSAAC